MLLEFGAALLALVGGALVALVLGPASGLGFRPTWVVASLLLFVVPGAIARARIKRDERHARSPIHFEGESTDG